MNRALLLAAIVLAAAGCKTSSKKKPIVNARAVTSTAAPDQKAVAEAQVPSPIEPWRQQPPAPGPAAELQLPVFKKDKLSNGLTLLVTEVHALPIVSFVLVSRGGSSLDNPKQAGLTALTFAMLDEGAGKRNAMEFSDAMADLGASFHSAATQDGGTLAMSGLSRNADPMLALMADVVLRPRLDQKDFDRVKQQTLATLLRARGSPEGLAFEQVPAMIYGPDHPYGHPVNGIEATVSPLTLGDVKSMLQKAMVPSASALIVSGDLTVAQAKQLAEKHLGNWRGGAAPKVTPPAVEAKKREHVLLVHKNDSPQTMVVLGRPMFGRGHPDETALIVANEVFGGSFASRLNMNLREDKGYTYGAHSTASLRRNVGALFAYAMVRTDVTALSVKEFLNELAALDKKPLAPMEIERAKDGLVRSLPGEFERVAAIASGASALFLYDLPLDYFAQYPGRVRGVANEEIQRVAKQYLAPDPMQILLVGDSGLIQKDVEALAAGTVVVKTP